MPKIDDGLAEHGPGRPLKTAWATLNVAEAQDLLHALSFWAEDLTAGTLDPDWHTHISDADGNELIIAVSPGET